MSSCDYCFVFIYVSRLFFFGLNNCGFIYSVYFNSDGIISVDWVFDLGFGVDDVVVYVIGVIVGDGRVGLRKMGILVVKVGFVNLELLEGGMGGGLLG